LALKINRNSPVPYYAQVKDSLRERIKQGDWQPGDQMPSEPELCDLFNVSRTVIRQALSELLHEGLIVRRKGRGTFVAEPKIKQGWVQRLSGFYQDMVAQGYTPVTQVLRQEIIPASPKVARYLELEPETSVLVIERLRFIQDEPIVLVTTYLPRNLCSDLLNEDLTHQSLYECLERTCGLSIAYGHRTLEAVPANDYESHLLRVKSGAPLLLVDSVSYLDNGTPLEYYHALQRGDRLRFEVELVRVHESGDVANQDKIPHSARILSRGDTL
jgi:GntR family transcriptional regulator